MNSTLWKDDRSSSNCGGGATLDLRVVHQRTERLLLERGRAGVQLIPALLIRTARPGDATIRASERHIIHRGHAAPHVHERLVGGRVRRRIDQFHIRRQRKSDPDETVLPQIAEIAGTVAIGAEIVRVDRPKQRIVGVGIEPPLQLQAA